MSETLFGESENDIKLFLTQLLSIYICLFVFKLNFF